MRALNRVTGEYIIQNAWNFQFLDLVSSSFGCSSNCKLLHRAQDSENSGAYGQMFILVGLK